MRYFKKFTDFCSGFACFTALIYLFRQYMVFDFGEEGIGLVEKLKLFLSRERGLEYYLMAILAITLICSVLSGIILKRFPQLAILFALPPLTLSIYMLSDKYIKEYPMMYPLLSAIAVIGCVFECVRMDSVDGKHRCAWAGNIVCAATAWFCFYVYKRPQSLAMIDESQISGFDREIYTMSENMDMKLFFFFGVAFAVLALVGVLLSDVYFIDAILSLPTLVMPIYLWSAGKLAVHPEILVTLAIVAFGVRIIPTFSCRIRQA